MSLNKATVGAIGFSGVTLLVCLFAIASIYNEVQNIWSQLDNEMDGFKLQADELWKEMVQLGAATPSNRQRRQSYGGYGASGHQPSGGGYGGGPSGGPSGHGPPQFTGPSGGGPSGGGCPNSGGGCCSKWRIERIKIYKRNLLGEKF